MFENPIEMRFATNFLMIYQLLEVKFVIEQTIINHEWTTYFNTLHHTHGHRSQGEICLNKHKEGQVLGYLCQIGVHGRIGFSGIKNIQWQMNIAWGGRVACHVDIGTCFIITRSTIFMIIKPCICGQTSNLPLVGDASN